MHHYRVVDCRSNVDHYHITSVVNYKKYTRRLIEQEDLDHSGVT